MEIVALMFVGFVEAYFQAVAGPQNVHKSFVWILTVIEPY